MYQTGVRTSCRIEAAAVQSVRTHLAVVIACPTRLSVCSAVCVGNSVSTAEDLKAGARARLARVFTHLGEALRSAGLIITHIVQIFEHLECGT